MVTISEAMFIRVKEYKEIFKEHLDPGDRVNIPPVHLEVDESRGVSPVQATKATPSLETCNHRNKRDASVRGTHQE